MKIMWRRGQSLLKLSKLWWKKTRTFYNKSANKQNNCEFLINLIIFRTFHKKGWESVRSQQDDKVSKDFFISLRNLMKFT